jgi:hypothetical protein
MDCYGAVASKTSIFPVFSVIHLLMHCWSVRSDTACPFLQQFSFTSHSHYRSLWNGGRCYFAADSSGSVLPVTCYFRIRRLTCDAIKIIRKYCPWGWNNCYFFLTALRFHAFYPYWLVYPQILGNTVWHDIGQLCLQIRLPHVVARDPWAMEL